MFNPKQNRTGVWVSDDKSREISSGLTRGEMLYDLGWILANNLEQCETQLEEDERIFESYEMESDSLRAIIANDNLKFKSYEKQIDLHIDEFKSQRRQKWVVTIAGAVAAYFAIFDPRNR